MEVVALKLSLETSLLTLTGFALIYLAVTGPLSGAFKALERARDDECAFKAIRALDLAIATSMGGGSASSQLTVPCRVEFSHSGSRVTARAGNSYYSVTYPFRVVVKGWVEGSGTIRATWTNGTVFVEVKSYGG